MGMMFRQSSMIEVCVWQLFITRPSTCRIPWHTVFHRVAFFVAAPTTTLDPACPSGKSIVIEERPPEELTHFRGERVVVEGMQVRLTAAFDCRV